MHQLLSDRVKAGWGLLLILLAGSALTAQAEDQYKSVPNAGGLSVMRSSGPGQQAVCGRQGRLGLEALRASAGAAGKADLQTAGTRYTTVGGDIIVDFTGFTAEAQAAFQFAVDILAGQLNLDIPIHVEAAFEPLGESILGAAGPSFVFLPNDPNSGLPAVPPALLDQLTGMDVLGPGEADIESSFNSTEPNWYFGTDSNPAANQFDFVTVVLHELFHGLGFIDSFDIDANPTQGIFGVGPDQIPVVYDIFLVDGSGNFLVEDFPNPSPALLAAMTGNDLFFAGPDATSANGGTPPRVFAPAEFQFGSSIAHWDDDTFPSGNPNALMTPFVGSGEANHDPGPNAIGLLRDLGYLNAMRSLSLSIPQFGDGAGLTSDIVVVNLSRSREVQGNVNFFDEDGNALAADSVVAGGTAFVLAPLGSRTFASRGTSPGLTTGSAVVESNGEVSAVLRFDLTGSGVAGVGSAPSLSSAIAPVRRQGALSTGIAFRNTSPMAITVNLTLKDENGNPVANGTASEGLAVNARKSLFIQELFPLANTANFKGTLCLDAPAGTFAAVAIELEFGRAFTTLPVAAPEN